LKRLVFIIALAALVVTSVFAGTVDGRVVAVSSRSVVVETNMGLTYIDLYSGIVNRGDRVVGDFHSYGSYTFYNRSTGGSFQGYVDDWGK